MSEHRLFENKKRESESVRSLLTNPDFEGFHGKETGKCWFVRKRNFFCTRSEGHYCLALAKEQIKVSDSVLNEHDELYFFLDWESLKTYDSDARSFLTKWCVSNRAALKEVHILSSFRIVKMGVAVANIALAGRIVSHDSWISYKKSFEKSWGSTQELPESSRI